MKIRIMGSGDLIIKLNNLLRQFNSSGKIYDNRGSTEKRLYLDLDDRQVENMIYSAEDGIATLAQLKEEQAKEIRRIK